MTRTICPLMFVLRSTQPLNEETRPERCPVLCFVVAPGGHLGWAIAGCHVNACTCFLAYGRFLGLDLRSLFCCMKDDRDVSGRNGADARGIVRGDPLIVHLRVPDVRDHEPTAGPLVDPRAPPRAPVADGQLLESLAQEAARLAHGLFRLVLKRAPRTAPHLEQRACGSRDVKQEQACK